MKKCSKCGELKTFNEFYAMKGMKDGYRNDCKLCNLAAKHERYRKNPKQTIDRVQQWRESNKDRYLAYQAEYRQRPDRKAAGRAGHLKRKFGISPEQYEEMLKAQRGGCAICGRVPEAGKTFHVDHDHDTGAVRGLLCQPCNHALGLFQESSLVVDRARTYLQAADDEDLAELMRLTRERVRRLVAAR